MLANVALEVGIRRRTTILMVDKKGERERERESREEAHNKNKVVGPTIQRRQKPPPPPTHTAAHLLVHHSDGAPRTAPFQNPGSALSTRPV